MAAPGSFAADRDGDTVVERWFGDAFSELHPLLKSLHRQGGVLRGRITIDTGRGLAGLVGRRLARRLRIPLQRNECGFVVRITHEPDALIWRRGFDDGAEMLSTFVPYGQYPCGGWYERSGPLRLDLGVDTRDGGWQWRLRGARWQGVPIPRVLLPQAQAGKRIVDGDYVFAVEFRLPLIGRVLHYAGRLAAQAADPR